jgi:hypothetical protein
MTIPSTVSEIGLLAISAHHYSRLRKQAKYSLERAYSAWKSNNEVFHHIERDSPEWNAIMEGTAVEYRVLEEAKRQERNIQAQLKRAIDKGVRV